MRLTILLIAILTCLYGCTGKAKKTKSNKKTELQKTLLTVESFTYTTDSNGKINKEIKKTQMYDFGILINTLTEEKVYQYSKSGSLKSTNTFRLSDSAKHLSELVKFTKGIIETIKFHNKDTIWYENQTFKNNLLIKSIKNIQFVTGDKIQEIVLNKYNNSGDIERKEIYNFANELLRAHDYKYKKDKDSIIVENRNNQGEVIGVSKQFFVDDKLSYEVLESANIAIDSLFYSEGKLIKEVSTDLLSGRINIFENEYDEKGRLKEIKNFFIEK